MRPRLPDKPEYAELGGLFRYPNSRGQDWLLVPLFWIVQSDLTIMSTHQETPLGAAKINRRNSFLHHQTEFHTALHSPRVQCPSPRTRHVPPRLPEWIGISMSSAASPLPLHRSQRVAAQRAQVQRHLLSSQYRRCRRKRETVRRRKPRMMARRTPAMTGATIVTGFVEDMLCNANDIG